MCDFEDLLSIGPLTAITRLSMLLAGTIHLYSPLTRIEEPSGLAIACGELRRDR